MAPSTLIRLLERTKTKRIRREGEAQLSTIAKRATIIKYKNCKKLGHNFQSYQGAPIWKKRKEKKVSYIYSSSIIRISNKKTNYYYMYHICLILGWHFFSIHYTYHSKNNSSKNKVHK